jgi:hypothetical protein
MTEFKKGDRIVFTKDDAWWGRGERVRMPKGTLGTYDDHPGEGAPWVRLDTGERVRAWASRLAPAEDHGTGDGSASDICAEPGCNCDLERRFPAPLDPAAVKAGDTVTLLVTPVEKAKKPFTVTGEVYGAPGALMVGGLWVMNDKIATLIAQRPAPEPEPEWKPGTVYAAASADGPVRLYRNKGIDRDYWLDAGGEMVPDEAVSKVRPLVVIDPADVDVVALQREIDDAMPGHEASVVLEHLGLNR